MPIIGGTKNPEVYPDAGFASLFFQSQYEGTQISVEFDAIIRRYGLLCQKRAGRYFFDFIFYLYIRST